MQLGIPTSVEKYELLEEIGCGGMATVYRARDLRLQRMVALKVMHPHLQGAKEARARFAREALTVARLRHPGLLEIFDYSGEQSDVSFIATELLTGPTLKRFAELHAHIPAEIAACMGLQVAGALSAAHQAGVIHRDVKPENVMIHEGRLKLTDFGIAQLLDTQGMTTTGQVLGSPGHMAPEQIEGKDCTAKTDIFALGTVLYLLATGELPFAGRNPHQVLKQIVEGRFRDPLQVCPAAGAHMADILRRCLSVDPEARYESAEALSRDLREFVADAGISDPDATLRAYLDAPEEFTASFNKDVIDNQVKLGERAAEARDYPKAREHWNRVLAMDESNARVLTAVQGLSRRERNRRLRQRMVIAVGSVGLIASLVYAWGQVVSKRTADTPTRQVSKTSTAGREPPQKKVADQGAPAASAAKSAAALAVPESVASQTHERELLAAVGKRSTSRASEDVEASNLPRLVVFSPVPANVSIGVDGAAPRPYGPSFHEMQLAAGEHRFTFVGAHDCCKDETLTVEIPAGEGPFTLVKQLTFRPAGLYVVTDAPANVLVDGKPSGRARSVIEVPQLSAMVETHKITVSAPGFEPLAAEVQLRAGQVLTFDADLVPR